MNGRPTRILIVDDSALYRQSIRNVLRDIANVEVVGTAADGVEALDKIHELQPDLLTLDVQMPGMDGIEVLREIKQRRLRPKAVMVSSFTSEGAQITTDALMEGAFDFILKPMGDQVQANRDVLCRSLEEKIHVFRSSLRDRESTRDSGIHVAATEPAGGAGERIPIPAAACRLVVLGTSTGGPAALKHVLPKLPEQFPIPVMVVQHMPEKYTRSLATRLDNICPLKVVEGEHGMDVREGQIVLAAGGKQTRLVPKSDRLKLEITDDPPENGVRPSVDYTLRSAVDAVRGNALAVILTGMGRDGLEGCRLLKDAGGAVFAQSQSDSIVFGMPKAVIDAELTDRILTLGKIAPAIVRHVKRSRGT